MIARPLELPNPPRFELDLLVRPGRLILRPEALPGMDVLSEVLRAVRLTGAIYFDVTARSPWVAETPALSSICAQVMPEFEYVIPFHIMLGGKCVAQLIDRSEPAIQFEAGDVILFPQGDGHLMATDLDLQSAPDYSLYYRPEDRPLPFVLTELGGDGDSARFVCGYLGCDARPFNPILSALPRMIHISAVEGEKDPTLELIRMAVTESENRRAGGETILAKLSELMFVQVLRRFIDNQPPESHGWLSGLRDPHISQALSFIHGRPAEDWTLERLAKDVGLSRTVFAERFNHFVDESPMRYLGRWRMQLAARALEVPGTSIAQAASEVGYQSEAAFNRAFKKFVGVPPGEWRRARIDRRPRA
jgi:AraC-like DNA-binding protein